MDSRKMSVRKLFGMSLLAEAALLCGLFCVAELEVAARNLGHRVGQVSTHSQADPAAGRRLFESSCAGCHGLDGRGGERGPDVTTRAQVVQLSDQETLGILREGRPGAGMPSFDSFGNVKLRALLSYLRFLQGKGAATVLPGDGARGKALFFGKARCSECHMVQGAGGFLGRDLTFYGAATSARTIREKITATGEFAERGNRITQVTLRDSQRFSGVIRNEDNFSLQLQSRDGTFHLVGRSDIVSLESLPEPIMPSNYGSTLSAGELDDLVKFLVTVGTANKPVAKREWEEDD
jgi:cytochrome c oxidase cbb3-type subunit III